MYCTIILYLNLVNTVGSKAAIGPRLDEQLSYISFFVYKVFDSLICGVGIL